MKIFVKFGKVEAYGEECKLYSFLNGHVMLFVSKQRFRFLLEVG